MSTRSLCDCPDGSLQSLTCWPNTMQIKSANSSHLSAARLPSSTVLLESLRQLPLFSRQLQAKCTRLPQVVVLDLVPRPAFPWRHCLPSSRACLAEVLHSLPPQPQCTTGGCFPLADIHTDGCLHGVLQLNSAEAFVAVDAECAYSCTVHGFHCITCHCCKLCTCKKPLAHNSVPAVVSSSAIETGHMLFNNAAVYH